MTTHNLTGKPNVTVHANNSLLVLHQTNVVYAVFDLAQPTDSNAKRFAVVDMHSDLKDSSGLPVPESCEYHEVVIAECNERHLVETFGIEDDDWIECYTTLGIDFDKITRVVLGSA